MANLPDKNADYARLDYWNDRYTHEETFEWCKSYSSFKHLIDEHVKRSDKILMLGEFTVHSAFEKLLILSDYRLR